MINLVSMLIHLMGGPERWAGKTQRYEIDENEVLRFTQPDAVYLVAKPRQVVPTVDGEAVIFVYIGESMPGLS